MCWTTFTKEMTSTDSFPFHSLMLLVNYLKLIKLVYKNFTNRASLTILCWPGPARREAASSCSCCAKKSAGFSLIKLPASRLTPCRAQEQLSGILTSAVRSAAMSTASRRQLQGWGGRCWLCHLKEPNFFFVRLDVVTWGGSISAARVAAATRCADAWPSESSRYWICWFGGHSEKQTRRSLPCHWKASLTCDCR